MEKKLKKKKWKLLICGIYRIIYLEAQSRIAVGRSKCWKKYRVSVRRKEDYPSTAERGL